MGFDTLQRWKESKNVDTSGFRITPVARTPIPKSSAWPGIASALEKILPQLDPLEIAKRKLAMRQVPITEAKIAYEEKLLPLRQQVTEGQLQFAKEQIPYQRKVQEWRQKIFAAQQQALEAGDLDPSTMKTWTASKRASIEARKARQLYGASYMRHKNKIEADPNEGPLPGLGGPAIPDVP